MIVSEGLSVRIKQQAPIPLDAHFSCAPKELLALVGPSGGGKSTILRAIAGLFHPGFSDITVNGDIWSSTVNNIHVAVHKRRVGMVFQGYALFPHMSILNNVSAAIDNRNATQRRQFALQLLAQVNLSGIENRKPHHLSGGQQQRVAVARALAREPEVLLLDEPFAAVDKLTRRRLYREVIKLRRELDIPVVLITHDLDEAAILADTMVVLHRGKTVQSGTPDQVLTQPVTPEVARLVDIRNVFTGIITDINQEKNRIQLLWAGQIIEASTQDWHLNHAIGNTVSWVIPDGCVVVQRNDRPSSSISENIINGTVDDVLIAGQTAQITLKPHCATELPLYASVPLRIVRLNHIVPGAEISVSLLPGDIHVMHAR